jgi:uncharacterized protein
MKFYPLFIFLLSIQTTLLKAQDVPLIEVEGKSEIKVRPDQAMINIHLREIALQASDASQKLNQKATQILENLKKRQIPDYEAHTSNYFVTINRIYRERSTLDSGYVATQTLNLQINEIENAILQVMEVLGDFAELNYAVNFQMSDSLQKSKDRELLTLALENARDKALTIAAALELGEIYVKQVKHLVKDQNYWPPMRMSADFKAESAGTPPVFLPEDQTLTDRVTVIFGFKP